jgi:serine/threonine protein phosphatase PrpC
MAIIASTVGALQLLVHFLHLKIVVIVGDRVICANVGDSRAILSRNGKPVCLSKDFKPDNPDEKRRIEEAGGFVMGKRLNSKLATSRTFGNFRFKIISRSEVMEMANGGGQDIVTVIPQIRELQLNWLTDEFIVIGCDGLFDMLSNNEVVSYVRDRLAESEIAEQKVQETTEEIVQLSKKEAVRLTQHSDNITACVIALSRGVTKLYPLGQTSTTQETPETC